MADDTPSQCLHPFVAAATGVAAIIDDCVRGDLGGARGERLRQLGSLGRLAANMRSATARDGVELHPVLGRFGAWMGDDGAGPLRIVLPPLGFVVAKGVPPAGLEVLGVHVLDRGVPCFDVASRGTDGIHLADADAFDAEVVLDLTTATDVSAMRSASDVGDCLEVLGRIHAAFGMVGALMEHGRRPRRPTPTVSVLLEEVRRVLWEGLPPTPLHVSGASVTVTFQLAVDAPNLPFRVLSIARKPR